MKKLNQKGFTGFEIALLVLVLAAIGFAGYTVYQNQKSNEAQTSTDKIAGVEKKDTEEKESPRCDEGLKEFSDEKVGVRFCYPEKWGLEIGPNVDFLTNRVSLTSPDYHEDPEASFGGSKTGSVVSVIISDTTNPAHDRVTVQSILDGTEKGKLYYSDVSHAKVAGYDGAKYIAGYEGPRSSTYAFEHNKKKYSLGISEDIDGPNFNDNQADFEKIVKSFQLLSN